MIRVGRGRNSITLEGLEAKELEDSLRKSLGPLIDEMEKKGEELIKKARETWPVKTGQSKAGFYTSITIIDSFTIEISILNREKYVPYIKSTKIGSSEDETRIRSPLQKELREPLKFINKELRSSLPKILEKTLGEQNG